MILMIIQGAFALIISHTTLTRFSVSMGGRCCFIWAVGRWPRLRHFDLARAETFTKLFGFIARRSRRRMWKISHLRDGEMSSFRRRPTWQIHVRQQIYTNSRWDGWWILWPCRWHDQINACFTLNSDDDWGAATKFDEPNSAFRIVFSLVPLTRWTSCRFITRYGRRPTLFQARLWLELSEEIIRHAKVFFGKRSRFKLENKFHVMQWIRRKE